MKQGGEKQTEDPGPIAVMKAMALGAAVHELIRAESGFIAGAALGVAVGYWLETIPPSARAASLDVIIGAAKELAA